MQPRMLVGVIFLACVMDGALAGGGINRALVHMPAWREVGPIAWAIFSRHADLSIRGLVLYPLEAFSGMVLSVLAAFLLARARGVRLSARLPAYAAALFTIGGLLLTIKAAPIMLSVKNLGDDGPQLLQAFNGFELWGGLRSLSQALGFLANLLSLAAVSRLAGER
jgi:hypothetical protein